MINGLLKQKNDTERMKDSHYYEQADVFFSYYTAGFHQTLLITVCTLVFLQFKPLTFIWSTSVCIRYVVTAMLFLCESVGLLAEWKDFWMVLGFIFRSNAKKKILNSSLQQLRMRHRLYSHFQGEAKIF